jgi:hypothetical protein
MRSALLTMMLLLSFASLLAQGRQVRRPPLEEGRHYAVRAVPSSTTVELDGVGRIRLLGVTAANGISEREAGAGPTGRAQLASLVLGRYVRIEFEAGSRSSATRAVYLVRDDGLFVNAELLRRGAVRLSTRSSSPRAAELKAAAERGRPAPEKATRPQARTSSSHAR